MKKLAIFCVCLLAITLGSILAIFLTMKKHEIAFGDLYAFIRDTKAGEIIVNGNFTSDFTGWNAMGIYGTSISETNGIRFLKIEGENEFRRSVVQTFDLVEGHSYDLSFDSYLDSGQAIVILKSSLSRKEQYVFPKADSKLNSNLTTLVADASGEYSLVVTMRSKGNLLVSNFSLKDVKAGTCLKLLLIILAWLCLIAILLLFSLFARQNISFSLAIALISLIPVLHINLKSVSVTENRNLAKYKPLFIVGENSGCSLNKQYGSCFDSWINDRYFCRENLMLGNTMLRSIVNRKWETRTVGSGSDDFFYNKSNIETISGYSEDEESKFSATLASIKRLNEFCKKSGIVLYVQITPCNEEVYCENVKGLNLRFSKGLFANTIERLRLESGANLLYCYDALVNSKPEGLTCYKTDHHWTPFGAYKCYLQVMEEIRKNFPDVKSLTTNDYAISKEDFSRSVGFGSLFSQLGIPKNMQFLFYPKNGFYLNFLYKHAGDVIDKNMVMTNPYGIDKSVLIFGDSMTTIGHAFYRDTFKKVRLHRKYGTMNMPEIEKVMQSYKPDIAVMIVHFTNFGGIKNWYK